MVIERDTEVLGYIALSDTIKPEVTEAISALKRQRIQTVMITGDNAHAANYIAKQAGIDSFIANVLPQEKAEEVKKLQQDKQIVAYVGDGINDAPALTQASIGIAMATGTDVAIESADVVVLHGDITRVVQAIHLSQLTLNTVKQNLFWAFAFNFIGIPLAAGLFYPLLGILLNPIFAGLAMALSSVSVVTNSLLLKGKRI